MKNIYYISLNLRKYETVLKKIKMKELPANTKKTLGERDKMEHTKKDTMRIFLFIVFSERGIKTMIFHKFQKYRKEFFLAAFLCIVCFAANLLYDSIPDKIYTVRGEERNVNFGVPVTVEKEEVSVPVLKNMTSDARIWDTAAQKESYRLTCRFLNLIPVKQVDVHVVDKTYVMPSGMPVGIYTKTKAY